MIQHYRFGHPIHTGAVLDKPTMDITPVMDFPGWDISPSNGSLSKTLSESMRVFGLGETVRGMNKRGWIYISNNTDDPNHDEDKRSLYASQNFILLASPEEEEVEAIFIDDPGTVRFDIGYTELNRLIICSESGNADIYRFTADSADEIVRQFRAITGQSYIPPKWAFGFGQSRWGYKSEEDIRAVFTRYQDASVPLDSIYLDIDYMERYKDFTVNTESFPHFSDFVEEMQKSHVHLVPIIDAGVKMEEGYETYEEGCEKDYFVKKENGERLVAAVWPGRVHFPDFFKPEVQNWFGHKYQFLLEQGIDGFWNDMNEPAIFYTEDRLKEVFEEIEKYKNENLDIQSYFAFTNLVSTLGNNPADYRRFYHEHEGQTIRHDKVHNLFGFYMTKAAGEALRKMEPNKRILLFSRSSYIGMHRYGGVWTGDNKSWWSHLLLSLQQMPALNMCGFLYSGSDIGGFGADCTEDLMARWLSLAILTPLYRNHACAGTRLQELYQFQNLESFRKIIELRYALIPYIYSEFMKAAIKNEMYFRPLSFIWSKDSRAYEVEDQVVVGESIMLAPVVEQNHNGRAVYLPESMKMIRFKAWNDYTEEILPAGTHYVECRLFETILFLRKGHVLPLIKPAKTTAELDYASLKFICYDADPKDYTLYNDDGFTRNLPFTF